MQQTRGPRASQLLRHFGPAAVQVLSSAAADPVVSTPAPAAAPVTTTTAATAAATGDGDSDDDWGFDDAAPSSSSAAPAQEAAEENEEEEQHLLAEATKLLLLGFTSLSPSSVIDLPTLQARHLALSLPLLSRLIQHRYSTTTGAAATAALGPARTATRQLLAQALLAVARAAPGPFKDGVQRLPPQDKAALEGALRAAVAGPGAAVAATAAAAASASAGAAPSAAPLKIDMSRYT